MSDKRLAYIGLGNMGLGMASRLAESGYDVTAYNRTRAKGEDVEKLGGHIADSPAEAAAEADVVMLSLADQDVVSAMLFGENGVFGSLKQGGYVVDMSTVPPAFARELAQKAAEAGYRALDACVYGAPMHARTGELRVMVGGAEEDYREIEPVLESLGKQLAYLGPNGMGATMKLVVNMLMGVQMPALAEAVVFGERAGLPRERILEMIKGSGYSSPVMNFRCPMMQERTFERAAFKLALMRKDMMLVMGESQELGVPMPVSEAAYSMLTAAKQQGLGDLDVAAIVAFQERLAGMDDYPWPVDGQPAGE
ncbi:MAG: NAD(P)-dependent oxidoreductase [Solirubrobacterales bacterium]